VKKTLISTLALVLLVPLGGCWELGSAPIESERWDDGDDWSYPDDWDTALEGELTIQRSVLAGDIGAVRGFAIEPDLTYGYRDGFGYTNLTVEATTESGELVMAIAYFDAGVLEQELGTTVTYAASEYYEMGPAGDAPFMDLTGCSGADGMIDFDIPADEVDVTLEPSSTNPDMVTMSFVATFRSDFGTQTAEGSFDIEVPGGETGTTAP